ncbi:MAG: methyl-accepting chemotaxis protein [Steroidobacteraceae bacterium]
MAIKSNKRKTRDRATGKTAQTELLGKLAAIDRSQAVIEFAVDGTILTANENFLKTFGYTLDEIAGKHHGMFVDSVYRGSNDYRQFWEKLGSGEYDAGQYKRIGKGGKEVWIQASYNPIMDMKGKVLKVVKYATDITEQRRQNEINGAFKGALDNLTSNVMVADADLNIVYMNTTVREMLNNAQADIRKDLPSFDVGRLMGANIDTFHKNPAHQRSMLAGLNKTFTSQLKLGGRTLRIIANPMTDAAGKRLGTVVEWADRTTELSVEREVQDIVKSVCDGNFDARISLEGKSGFFEALGKGINGLVDNVADVVVEVQKLVQSVNAGDLTKRMDPAGKEGLFVKIGSGINQLTDNVGELVSRVQAAAMEVTRGAGEISQGNLDLSQRTEEQASSLEETASSMEQMTSTVKQNADNAKQASQLATAARDQADKGGAVVSKAITAMKEINESSKKIVDIISVIDEIAFQTNLLALNAAVEAARAGEQGRGFAVVASEVRNLASRSATAAKEIKGLIQDSVKKVEEGSSLVTQSGHTLEQIVSSNKKVSDIIGEIAAASMEQSVGIEQVNKAVLQLDEVTQQNAALVEEATAASQSLAEQATNLSEMMERYQVSAEVVATARASMHAVGAVPPTTDKRGSAATPAKDERRAPGRPWHGAEKKRVQASPARLSEKSGSATGTDPDWKQF